MCVYSPEFGKAKRFRYIKKENIISALLCILPFLLTPANPWSPEIISVSPKTLRTDLEKAVNNFGVDSDVEFTLADGETVRAHRALLAIKSPVFKYVFFFFPIPFLFSSCSYFNWFN